LALRLLRSINAYQHAVSVRHSRISWSSGTPSPSKSPYWYWALPPKIDGSVWLEFAGHSCHIRQEKLLSTLTSRTVMGASPSRHATNPARRPLRRIGLRSRGPQRRTIPRPATPGELGEPRHAGRSVAQIGLVDRATRGSGHGGEPRPKQGTVNTELV